MNKVQMLVPNYTKCCTKQIGGAGLEYTINKKISSKTF